MEPSIKSGKYADRRYRDFKIKGKKMSTENTAVEEEVTETAADEATETASEESDESEGAE